MTVTANLTVNYELNSTSDCSGVLFEIPVTEIVGGDQLEIRLWGIDFDMLGPYTLYKGTESMGAGENFIAEADTIEENIDFAELYKYQAKFPIQSISNIEAISEVYKIDGDGQVATWATRGQDITNKFARAGFSCIISDDRVPLYGSVKLTYVRPPYQKRWFWTVPIGSEGTYWFFIYKSGLLKNKFAIALPDLTDGVPQPRNITMHVLAYDSDVNIVGASVYIDDNLMGISDADGLLDIDGILTGNHTLRITHPDYTDTDLDSLYNDEFSVY